jgi:hypothetical protein
MTYKERERLIRDLKSGKEPMTREGMIVVLNELSLPFSPLYSTEDNDDNDRVWLAAAKPEWLDAMLAVFAAPPPEEEQNYHWETSTYIFFRKVARRFPEQALAKITALLPTENDALRPYLICGLGGTEHQEAGAWLQPFVDNIEKLPLQELAQLTDALPRDDTQEWLHFLLRVRDAIPPVDDEEHDDMREYAEFRIDGARRKLDEGGNPTAAST